MTTLLVLDFDGTMTDAEREGAPFRGAYLDDIATLAALPRDEVEALAARFEREVADNAHAEGWLFGGHIVAPATVDPYLRIMPVARMVFDHYGRFMNGDDRDRLLDGILYKYNYPKTRTVFREGAREVLLGTPADTTYVVTNSHTIPVQDKIKQLSAMGDDPDALLWLVERVHGRAKKYVLDQDFEAVDEELRVPNLSRPILLRRRQYFEALTRLLEVRGADWSELTVIGDIFELDLALPLSLGATVGLVANAHTPQYEMDYLESHERGRVLRSLPEAGDWLASF